MDSSIHALAPLFEGISPEEAQAMLPCLGAMRKQYEKGERIMRSGQPCDRMGIVLSGQVRVEVSDAWGNVAILEMLGPGSLFAHSYACSGKPLDIDAVADTPCEVTLVGAERIIHPCPKQCSCHAHIASNLMRALALRNLDMNRRAMAMAPKTIRSKVLTYLSQQKKLSGSNTFSIPYSQTKLASYLGIDRSALSSELSKLRREGIIDYEGSTYKLL